MLREKDFFAPLDQNLIQSYAENKYSGTYESPDDVWALGVTSLCFLFHEDFNNFYDWNKKVIRKEKIDGCIKNLYAANFHPMLLKIVSEMLDTNHYTRIKLGRLYEILNQKAFV